MHDSPGWRTRGYLPHFDAAHLLQAISYRLEDALPAEVVARLREKSRLQDQRQDLIERYIDAGHGKCLLRKPHHAAAVVENWRHFDRWLYHLYAWVVMPNHVHVLIEPIPPHTTAKIVQAWKSYTAKVIQRAEANDRSRIPAKPRLWQREYWDRYIRNERHYQAAVAYIHGNPVKAGLCEKADAWPWSSAAPGIQTVE